MDDLAVESVDGELFEVAEARAQSKKYECPRERARVPVHAPDAAGLGPGALACDPVTVLLQALTPGHCDRGGAALQSAHAVAAGPQLTRVPSPCLLPLATAHIS